MVDLAVSAILIFAGWIACVILVEKTRDIVYGIVGFLFALMAWYNPILSSDEYSRGLIPLGMLCIGVYLVGIGLMGIVSRRGMGR